VLAENVGTLNLKSREKNRSGAAKKWHRNVRLADAFSGVSASSQIQQDSPKVGPQPQRSQIQTL
jgi:hypothetical protein